MSLTYLTAVATETHSEPAVNAYAVGGVTLLILLALLGGLLMFGKGREHA